VRGNESDGGVLLRMTNKAAQQLGRMGKGKPKTLTQAERKRRGKRLAEARKLRWPHTSNAPHQARRGSDVALNAVVGGSSV